MLPDPFSPGKPLPNAGATGSDGHDADRDMEPPVQRIAEGRHETAISTTRSGLGVIREGPLIPAEGSDVAGSRGLLLRTPVSRVGLARNDEDLADPHVCNRCGDY